MKFKKINPYLLCVLSGFATALSFTFDSLSFLCLFSLVPLIWVLISRKVKLRIALSYVMAYSLSYYIPLLLWLWELYPLTGYGLNSLMSFIFLSLSTMIIGVVESGFMCLAFIPFNTLKRSAVTGVPVFAFLYILGEAMQERTGVFGFPWGRLGVIPYKNTAFIQSASILGSLFISLLIVLINGLLAYWIIKLMENPKTALIPLSAAIGIYSANISFGMLRLKTADKIPPDVNVVVVQGNLSSITKWDTSLADTLDIYISLSESQLTHDTDIIVWPETAVPTVLQTDEATANILRDFTARNNVTLITGVFDSVETDGRLKDYNAMVAISPNGTITKPYYKQKLVPLGEFTPFEEALRNTLPMVFEGVPTSITPGTESVVLPTAFGRVGGLICYESIFPVIARDIVNNGAELIAIISNDSWFGQSPAIAQHHAQAIIRAVESGRYVVRAGNTGMSSITDCYGRTRAYIPPFESSAFSSNVRFISRNTVFGQIGDVILLPSLALLFYAAYLKIRQSKI